MRRLALAAVCCALIAGCGHSSPRPSSGAATRPSWIQVSKHRALEYWHKVPCGGHYTVAFMKLAPQLYGQFWLWKLPDGTCAVAKIGLQRSILGNVKNHAPFPVFCGVMIHEIGHLVGFHQQGGPDHGIHSSNPYNVMYPTLTARNIPRVCKIAAANGDEIPLSVSPHRVDTGR